MTKIYKNEKGTLLEAAAVYRPPGAYELTVNSYGASEDVLSILWDVKDAQGIITEDTDYFNEKRWSFCCKQMLNQLEDSFPTVKDMLEFMKTHPINATIENKPGFGLQYNYRG